MNTFYPIKKRGLSEILRSEEDWTKGAAARGPDGGKLPPDHPAACQWCLLGAYHASAQQSIENFKFLERAVKQVCAKYGVLEYEAVGFNDSAWTTFPMVSEAVQIFEESVSQNTHKTPQ